MSMTSQVVKTGGDIVGKEDYKDYDESKEDKNVDEGKEEGNEEDSEEASVPLSELKRRLSQAKKSHQEELRRLELEKKKEVKKAKMTQAEKKVFDIEDREKQLEKRERELNRRELESKVSAKLTDNELPKSFTELLISLEDEELIDIKVKELKSTWDEAINNTVKGKISHPVPKVEGKGVKGREGKISRADIFKRK